MSLDLRISSANIQIIELIGGVIAVAGGVAVVVKLINRGCKRIVGPHREYNQFVNRIYTKDAQKAITKFYIPTRAQDIDPCEQEEIRDNNGKFLSEPLIPFFCNHAFLESSRGKYYLVLADSGMGKTTFLLRLYKECLFGRKRKKKKTKFVPLAYQNALQSISTLPDKKNTILLLDGLDENMDAINDYEVFFGKLLNYTEEFDKIVITCRTQFFPNRAMEPAVTGKIQTVNGRKKEEIVKKYLSPFSDEEVKLYLRRRYKYRKGMQRKAFRIVKQVPTLMARPIILNWIDFLCIPAARYQYSFQIYDVIIEKWIEREELGDGGRKLFDLSYKIAE